MTQAILPLSAPPAKVTLTERLAAYFRARPGQWIDGMALAQIAGSYAWRSRIADIRRAPHSMTIENRQRRVRVLDEGGMVAVDVSGFTVSEYRFMPGVTSDRLAQNGRLSCDCSDARNAGARPAPAPDPEAR